MADTQGLFDALAGAGGANINRPQLNAFVANSQANNGLRSAQTEVALLKAQESTEQAVAKSQVHDTMRTLFGPNDQSKADAASNWMLSGFGDAKSAMGALNEVQKNQLTSTISDPNQLGSPAQTAAQQGLEGKVATPVSVPNEFTTLPGAFQPAISQTPLGAAMTGAQNANALLHTAQATNPAAFHPGGFGQTPPEGIAALTKAISEGRLDPTRVNSRTAPLLAQIEQNTPGTNYNRLHADATLQSNANFQQKAMSVDMLPGLLSNMTTLGKKLNGGNGYNDIKSIGTMQKWMNGETNDPDYTEYMTVRNDSLLRLASVMRGVGMSDQAHTAEIEAASPTLAPYALDAWLKGQMSVVTPLLDRQNRITHLGEKGQGTSTLGGSSPSPAAPAPAGPTPLGQQIPGGGGGSLASYPDEASALAAGHKIGDRVMIGGVSGTLQ